jgi:hypothetical protein
MSLNTSLKGRPRNTNLPKSHTLFPLFEAVVNSIHLLDERIKLDIEIESNINNQILVEQLPWDYKAVFNSAKECSRAILGKHKSTEKMSEEVSLWLKI